MQCSDCEHMKYLIDSENNLIYFCVNTESGAYLEETDVCGNCCWEPEKYDCGNCQREDAPCEYCIRNEENTDKENPDLEDLYFHEEVESDR